MTNLNSKSGFQPKIGLLHTYDPVRGGMTVHPGSNCPPEQALVLPISRTEVSGKPMIVIEWIRLENHDSADFCLEVDVCSAECLYQSSDYINVKSGDPISAREVAVFNFSKFLARSAQKSMDEERLPRSAAAILMDGVELLGERGEGYDNGQERSAARIAAVFSALKGIPFTALDAWDFLMVLKLVRAQETTKIDSRADLTCYAALSAEEMENIIYGSGPSEIEYPSDLARAKEFAAALSDPLAALGECKISGTIMSSGCKTKEQAKNEAKYPIGKGWRLLDGKVFIEASNGFVPCGLHCDVNATSEDYTKTDAISKMVEGFSKGGLA